MSLTNLMSTEKQGILGETKLGVQGTVPVLGSRSSSKRSFRRGFRAHRQRFAKAVARQSELSGTRLVILILACLWLSRVFHILTRRIAQSLTGGARDEF